MACQAVRGDEVFDQLRFVNKIGTQIRSQVGEEVRTHSVEDANVVIHGIGKASLHRPSRGNVTHCAAVVEELRPLSFCALVPLSLASEALTLFSTRLWLIELGLRRVV
jgi:hypothetical protein